MSALHSLHYVLTHNGQGSVSLAQVCLVINIADAARPGGLLHIDG